MRRLAALVAVGTMAVAACSSNGDETSPNGTTADTGVAEPAPATDATASDAATTTAASTAPPTTVARTTVVESTSSVSETTEPATDRPVVINDAASVALDDEQPDETGPSGGDRADADDDPATGCAPVAPGVAEFVLDAGGGPHDVRVFVPDPAPTVASPVVLNFHGLTSNGPDHAAYTGYETVAQEQGFVVVHPTGLEASWELVGFDVEGRDDVAFVDALIDTLVADWCVDPERVYSTGFSNGGFFTARLLCERADRIAAAASIGGLAFPTGCAPSRPVPYIAMHGTDDFVVPFAGDGQSLLAGLGDPELDVFFTQVMPEEFAEFAASFGCDDQPTRTVESDDVIRDDYSGCDAEVPLTFYELPGSGHSWPNSPLAEQSGALGYHTSDIDATADAWAFFEPHTL